MPRPQRDDPWQVRILPRVAFGVRPAAGAEEPLSSAGGAPLRPDTPGVYSALQAVHLVKDVMAGQHAIPPEAIYLVVNRARDTTLRPDEMVKWGKDERRDFPPLAASIADDASVELAVNRREPAYYSSDALRGAARTLGNLLFPAAVAAPIEAAQAARVVKVGPVRVRL